MRFGVIIYGWDVWHKISLIRRLALQQADFIISISEYTKRRAITANEIDGERVFVLPNALEWKTSETYEPEIRPLQPQGTLLLSVGRLNNLEQQKGFDAVIESLPALALRIPDVQYIVIGSGTDLERHRQLARQLGVSQRVHFLGTVDEKKLRYYYQCCDVFVMPSAQEGFGFVYLEAMHYAKAVVAANSGGAPEVVQDGITGSLVQYGDKDQLAETLIDLCLDRNKRRRLGKAGYQRLQEEFTFPHFKQKLTEILMKELAPRFAHKSASQIR
ncbi:MAG: glycosyltransferase family 4 protein [Pyrinomonadaceae bacterium]|jgi:glycosyltransferase involved in cell wall biosynthesis|nr:glycosyltransferase family 4 protein [Pyrinomonadaceae bacterium]